jgi:hypothetical protein
VRKVLSVVCIAVTLGPLSVAQDHSLNTTRKASDQRGTLNEISPLMRVLRKPAVGSGTNLRANSQLAPSVHIYRFVTQDFPGASFTQVMASNNGVAVGNYSFATNSPLIPFTFKGGVYRTLTVPARFQHALSASIASDRLSATTSIQQVYGTASWIPRGRLRPSTFLTHLKRP